MKHLTQNYTHNSSKHRETIIGAFFVPVSQ
jgi:hypothetical protein